MPRLIRGSRTQSFEPKGSQEPFYHMLQPLQAFIPAAAPAPPPAPGPHVSIETRLNPIDSYIVDFHFDRLAVTPEDGLVTGNFSRDDMIVSDRGPSDLMAPVYRTRNIESKPDLRWIHVPWNSMMDTEALMGKICVDIGLKREAVQSAILSNDKWDDLLHDMSREGIHATHMQTTCLEIPIAKDLLASSELGASTESGTSKFIHRGANMVLFMPFLHWGREDVLKWRSDVIDLLQEQRENHPNTQRPIEAMLAGGKTAEFRFHAEMMANQLFAKKPLHLRRTLDQWYYSTTCDTARRRDNDQIVSKFGPEKEKENKRPILAVDQLWLWILGGNTVVTCFARRWPRDRNFQCNIVDRLLSWTLQQQARHIRNGYELMHLIINEASSFFFNYSSTTEEAIRFHEIFKLAISKLNNEQAELFEKLVTLYKKGPAWDQSREEQDALFELREEYELVDQVRDLLDELNMIGKVYEDQASIIDAIADFQYYDALFRAGLTDEQGNKKEISDGGGGPSTDKLLPVAWDPRDWFRRTNRLIHKYQDVVDKMTGEASQISESLQNTISLKQNSGSLFEAHASRKEAEAIMVFTLVSSCILPLSFFTSIFGMNISELSGENTVTLRVAMAYIIPLSVLLLAVFLGVAFRRDVRDRIDGLINGKKKKTKENMRCNEEGVSTGGRNSATTDRDSVRRRSRHSVKSGDVEMGNVG